MARVWIAGAEYGEAYMGTGIVEKETDTFITVTDWQQILGHHRGGDVRTAASNDTRRFPRDRRNVFTDEREAYEWALVKARQSVDDAQKALDKLRQVEQKISDHLDGLSG